MEKGVFEGDRPSHRVANEVALGDAEFEEISVKGQSFFLYGIFPKRGIVEGGGREERSCKVPDGWGGEEAANENVGVCHGLFRIEDRIIFRKSSRFKIVD